MGRGMRNLLTVREVAEQVGVNPKSVYRWLSAGVLPAVKLGYQKRSPVRVPADALDEFVYGEPRRDRVGLSSPFTDPVLPDEGDDLDAA
jgi:excisionase family DNA binding protein